MPVNARGQARQTFQCPQISDVEEIGGKFSCKVFQRVSDFLLNQKQGFLGRECTSKAIVEDLLLNKFSALLHFSQNLLQACLRLLMSIVLVAKRQNTIEKQDRL